MNIKFKYALILLFASSFLFANAQKQVYSSKNALKIVKINNTIFFTGLKNRAFFKLDENNNNTQILSDKIIIKNIYENNGKLNIEANDSNYLYSNSKLSKVNKSSDISKDKRLAYPIKQMERKIYIKKNNAWLKISPNNNDIYYAPKIKNNLILFSGVKSGILLYNINTKTTTFIDKGVDASFSSDGQKITYAKVYDDGNTYTNSEIFIYDINTKKITKILSKEDKIINRYPYLYKNILYFNKNFNIYKLNLNKE